MIKWYKFNIADLNDTEYEKWYSLMNDDRQKKVDSFKKIEDKIRTVAGEMLVKKVISMHLGIDEKNINICQDNSGKPYAENLDINFNISHSEDMVVCAINKNPIGIDIEKIRPIDLKIAKKICNEEELIYLFGFSPSEKDFKYTENTEILNRFFEIWTGKEAYVKLLGSGIKNIKDLPFNKTNHFEIINGYALSIIIN